VTGVLADASPLIAFQQVGQLHLLPTLSPRAPELISPFF